MERARRRLPRPRPALAVALAVAGGVSLIGLLILWLLPLLLTRHPSAGLSAADRLRAANDARQTLVAFLVLVGAAGTLFYTARSFALNRSGQVTERYTRAIDQIGSEALETRIGGIYALERIGRDSAADRPTVVYVLGAFVRSRSKCDRKTTEEPAEDVYAALRVASRLAPSADVVLNLRGADLSNARLTFMHDVQVHLSGTTLTGAQLPNSWAQPSKTADQSPDAGDPEAQARTLT